MHRDCNTWAFLYYSDTYVQGIWSITFSIEGQAIAQDFFEVSKE